MSSTAATRPPSPFEIARLALIERLSAMTAPRGFVAFPHPSDFDVVASHIREAAAIFDEWLEAIGAEVRDNSSADIDNDLFLDAFSRAVDGNETFACEEAGNVLRDERRAA
jgi:hypothetical protein